MTTSIVWFRRDLRLQDHPALAAACAQGRVVPVFVLDPRLLRPAGPNRLAFLLNALAALLDSTGGALRITSGDPVEVIPRVARATGAQAVHISSDHGPYGRDRDGRTAQELGEIPLIATGSPYGVTPGRLVKADGSPYRVYTPFLKAWRDHGIRPPARTPSDIPWYDGDLPTDELPTPPTTVPLPEATEQAAQERWRAFGEEQVRDYGKDRNRADLDRTSRLSPYLKWGLLHPRTLHAGLDASDGAQVFARELIWRDFYADVLWHHPRSARWDLTEALAGLPYDEPGPLFEAWQQGRTGYPFVDAGMRQLLAEGWMHNRVRMVVASFLTKDLHVHWSHGARHFQRHLIDGDLASNSHGWQWTAGTGTDASPYFRVFNPVLQGRTHDPQGDYVRRWVPELAQIAGGAIHEPWSCEHPPKGYPARVVDHAAERSETLARYGAIRKDETS